MRIISIFAAGRGTVPGAFYIEMALCVDRELSKRVPAVVRNVTFHNPIILSAEDIVIKVEVRDHGDGCVEYAFYEAGVEDGSTRHPARARYAAVTSPLCPAPTTIASYIFLSLADR